MIGSDCQIGPNSEIRIAKLVMQQSFGNLLLIRAQIGSHVNIGPFAHIRPKS